MFNKYEFEETLRNEILGEIENNTITSNDEIENYIFEELDTAVIYCSNCFDIVRELQVTDFSDFIAEGASTISDFAYHALREYIYNETDVLSDMEEALSEHEEEEEDEEEEEEDDTVQDAIEEFLKED